MSIKFYPTNYENVMTDQIDTDDEGLYLDNEDDFTYDAVDDFDYDSLVDIPRVYLDDLDIPLELRQFTEMLHTERALTNSLKSKHHFQPSREERVLTTKDIAIRNVLPILIKMGSWKTIVSLFNVNKTMCSYLDERNKKSDIPLKDEIKGQMFAYRQLLDKNIMAKYYRKDADYFMGRNCLVRSRKTLNKQLKFSHFFICANCDEAVSITTDTWIFIKEVYFVVSPEGVYHSSQNSYYLQKNKNSVFEDGFWHISEAKNCLDNSCKKLFLI